MKDRIRKGKLQAIGKVRVKVIGGEVFGLPKRERARRFDDETVIGIAAMLGDLRAEQERRSNAKSDALCLCCILPPEDVKRHILLKNGLQYLVMLTEARGKGEIPRGCFVVASDNGYEYEISEFYVQERFRRKGFGRMMFRAFVRRLHKDCGKRPVRIFLTVAKGNDAAEEFYRDLGFSESAKVMTFHGENGRGR